VGWLQPVRQELRPVLGPRVAGGPELGRLDWELLGRLPADSSQEGWSPVARGQLAEASALLPMAAAGASTGANQKLAAVGAPRRSHPSGPAEGCTPESPAVLVPAVRSAHRLAEEADGR
jgi:hypothetical protein